MPISNVLSNSTLSIDNSTLHPIPADGSFVGKWEDVSQFAILYTLWRTDVPGNMYFEFSMDGVVIDRSFTLVTSDLTDGNYASSGPRGRYFRIRYVNGSTAQNIFRLQTTYSLSKTDDAHAAVVAGVSAKSNSLVTRSVIHGLSPTSEYVPLKVTSDGAVVTHSEGELLPSLKTNKLTTASSDQDQEILSYTPTKPFYLSGFSFYVWDTMTSHQVVFGEASLESPPGTKLHTVQLTSMGLGKDQVNFGKNVVFPANQTLRLVCSPSSPRNQTWQGNLVGST